MASDGQPVQIRALLGMAWRGKWVLMMAAALAVGAAIYYTSRAPVTYQAEAQVMVEPVTYSLTPAADATINLETELKLALSDQVLALAAKKMKEPLAIGDLRRGLAVKAVPGTEIIAFSKTSLNPEVPAEAAQAAAEGYLEYRRSRYVEELVSSTDSISQRMGDEQRMLTRLNQRLDLATDRVTRRTLESQINATSGRIGALSQQLALIQTPDSLRVGQVVQPAISAGAVPPATTRNIIMALIVGLALGMGGLVLREHFDDRPKDRSDLELYAGAAMLAAIPKVSGWKRNKPQLVTAGESNRSLVAEAYRTLRTGVLFATSEREVKSLLITSAKESEGKSTITANLAVGLAQAGKRIVVVSADFRRPRLHLFFNKGNGDGLSTLLEGREKLGSAVKWTKFPNLALIPSGPEPVDPSHLLGSERMGSLIAELLKFSSFPSAAGERPDLILIDAPPLLPVADSMALASFVDAVLLVADGERTTNSEIEQARQRLDQVNARVLGSVLNRFDPTRARNYSSYYGQYSYKKGREPRNETIQLEPYA